MSSEFVMAWKTDLTLSCHTNSAINDGTGKQTSDDFLSFFNLRCMSALNASVVVMGAHCYVNCGEIV